MIDEPNPQCPHCIHREVCKNAEKYREIMIHISNEVGNMPDWLAYRLVCKDFRKTPSIEDLGSLFENSLRRSKKLTDESCDIPSAGKLGA